MNLHVQNHPLLQCLPQGSWFRDWVESWPLAEPPTSYILFSSMAVFGACLGRKVFFNQDVHKLFPMLNLLLIGPSGIGKTTSLEMAMTLLRELTEDKKPQRIDKATPEKLHLDLSKKPHAIVYAEELAAVFSKQKYMEAIVPYITKLLNYLDVVEERSKVGDIIRVVSPAVTVMGGSTVEWLQEQLPDSATTGGFLARFLIIKEESKRQRIALPQLYLYGKKKLEAEHKRAKVYQRFRQLQDVGAFEMRLDGYAASDAYTFWYNNYQPDTGYLAPFAARAGEFVLRLAMLVALSRGKGIMGAEDIAAATQLYEFSAAKLQDVVVPFTPQGKLLALVLKTVGRDTMKEADIVRGMRNFSTAPTVRVLVNSLIEDGGLVRLDDGSLRRK